MWEPRESVRTLKAPTALEGAGIYRARLQSLLASTDNVLTTPEQPPTKSARHFCQGVLIKVLAAPCLNPALPF